MKALILEDETLAAEKLIGLIHQLDADIEVLASLKSIETTIAWFEANEAPDFIISDIRLLDGLSFEIFKQITFDGPVIFTTAYDQYAIKAFEVNSVDYLLKPVQADKLNSSLQKLKKYKEHTPFQPVAYQQLMEMLQKESKDYKSRFMLRVGQKILAVPIEKIAYFYSQDKMTYIVTHEGKKYPHDQSLEIIDEQLDPRLFFRANRKYIVKFEAIDEIHPYFKGRVKIHLSPREEDDIVISADKTPEFKSWLDQ